MAHTDLLKYISEARTKKFDDTTIKNNLIATGWNPMQVDAGLKANPGDLPIPAPPRSPASAHSSGQSHDEPIAVVHNLSNRGFEYFIMLISLGIGAVAVGVLGHWLVDIMSAAKTYDDTPTWAVAGAIVTLPIFAFMTIRLKRAEKLQPHLLQDASRKRALQLTLVLAFIAGITHLIVYLGSLLEGNKTSFEQYGSSYSEIGGFTPAAADFMHMLVTVLIAGSIFVYYWVQLQHGKNHHPSRRRH